MRHTCYNMDEIKRCTKWKKPVTKTTEPIIYIISRIDKCIETKSSCLGLRMGVCENGEWMLMSRVLWGGGQITILENSDNGYESLNIQKKPHWIGQEMSKLYDM